jgi:hypothetical protein
MLLYLLQLHDHTFLGAELPAGPHGAHAFVIPGPPPPGVLPPGFGMPVGALGGPVDPYLPCQSRHFLAQRAANAAGQGTNQVSTMNLC